MKFAQKMLTITTVTGLFRILRCVFMVPSGTLCFETKFSQKKKKISQFPKRADENAAW